ncbi:MAG TPA: hypothetical protein DHT43_10070, partial [Deltaproteobacteria bacterium]|nr:hypothetical protein [Deltaproteobacteria bacterium]
VGAGIRQDRGIIDGSCLISCLRADSRGANESLKRSALHLQGLLRSPAGSCLRLAPPFGEEQFNLQFGNRNNQFKREQCPAIRR